MFIEHKEAGEGQELDETGKLLLKAAAVLERAVACDQWPHGHCAWSAIVTASGDDHEFSKIAGRRFAQAIGVEGILDIFDWNDSRETREEVVAKLRAVALMPRG